MARGARVAASKTIPFYRGPRLGPAVRLRPGAAKHPAGTLNILLPQATLQTCQYGPGFLVKFPVFAYMAAGELDLKGLGLSAYSSSRTSERSGIVMQAYAALQGSSGPTSGLAGPI